AKVLAGPALSDLEPLIPVVASYTLSFIYLGIYWNNHHHMLHVTHRIDGAILWANLHLLFSPSLVPFTTAWMGENHYASFPTTVYGVVLLMAGVAYYVLQSLIIRREGPDSLLAKAMGRDVKGKLSPVLYILAIAGSLISPWIAQALFVVVAIMWLVPDRHIEIAAS